MEKNRHTSLILGAVTALALVPALASAQELTGTYVSYADTSTTGSLVRGSHSVAYGETSGAGACDVFCQGTYREGYAIESGAAALSVESDAAATGLTSLSGPTVSGRSILWSGSFASGTLSVRIDQTVTYMTSDRAVGLTVVLTNTGTSTISNLYYMRGGDPDQNFCATASDYNTVNDVLRQPPTDTSAFVTATAGGVAVGLGTFDTRARADVSDYSISGAATRWSAPTDPGGTSADTSIALVFQIPSLAAGASTTLQMYYVFASTSATATTRFDALRSVTPACTEGASCTGTGGASGVCHASACCTGCWDGFACQTGTTSSSCGRGGASCASCNDAFSCTTDTCSSGSCSNVIATGCLVDGACRGSGERNPFDMCLACTPSSSATSWTSVPGCGVDMGVPPVDMGVPGEDLGVPGEDLGVPGEDMGMAGTDAGMGGDGASSGSDAGGPIGGRGSGRSRGGCDVGSIGASEGGGVVAIAMLLVVAFVRRRRSYGEQLAE